MTSKNQPLFYGLAEEGLTAQDWIELSSRNEKSYRRIAATIARRYPLTRGSVLDFGCGAGNLLNALADIWPSTVDLLGVEIEPGLVDWASEHLSRDNLHFRLANDPLADIEAEHYDLVVSTFTSHHWYDPEAYFQALCALVKPGGLAHVVDIHPASVYSRLLASPLYFHLFRPSRPDYEGYRHSRRHAFAPKRLRQALNQVAEFTYQMRTQRGKVIIEIQKKS